MNAALAIVPTVADPPTSPAGVPIPYARAPAALPQCGYFVYRPAGEYNRDRLLVLVHGITRNALEHVLVFKRWSDRLRVPLVAPLFSREAYRRYQTLVGRKRLPSADEAFDLVIADASAHLGMDAPRVFLFGYSGGAQFAHRYLFRHPRSVERAVIGAAGWYSFPDETLAYPLGLGADADGKVFAELATVGRYPPTLVVVGSEDRMRDDALNQDSRIDQLQGRHRRARAKRWVEAMNRTAEQIGCEPPCRLRVLRGASHSFTQAVRAHALDRVVIDFLFEASNPTANPTSNPISNPISESIAEAGAVTVPQRPETNSLGEPQ